MRASTIFIIVILVFIIAIFVKVFDERLIQFHSPAGIVDIITVDSPRPGSFIQSPVEVSGEARGFWFFEASFPIVVTDEFGNELGIGIAQAQDEWMTDNFVKFKAKVDFTRGVNRIGKIILKKDNPSGDPVRDQSLEIPIRFR